MGYPVKAQATNSEAAAHSVEAAFAHIDRRMALAFGLLVWGLMWVVLIAGGWYVRNVMERENQRLATITTEVLAHAVSHVSFAGKYQARLLLEELQKQQPGLVYLRLLDPQAHVIAHSDPQANDEALGDAERLAIAPLLDGTQSLQQRLRTGADGSTVREYATVYRGGYGNDVQGVLQLGIADAPLTQALYSAMFYIAALLFLLLVLGVWLTWRISRYFGQPVRQLAADMARERQRLQSVLDAMQAGTWEWDIVSGNVVLNERWAEMIGYTLAELEPLRPSTFKQLCHPEDQAMRRAHIQAHLAGQTLRFTCELRLRHKLGHWVWVLDSGCIIARNAQGQPLTMIGACQDISARKQAQEALRQESERFMALARVSNTGVWEWDAPAAHLWCSPEYFSMLGRSSADYAASIDQHGLPLEQVWLELLHPDDREQAHRHFTEYLASGTQGMYQSEFRMRHAEGHWVWIWSRGNALRDAHGQLSGRVMGTHINITSLKVAQERLRESQERLEQRVQERTAELSAALERLGQAQQELLQSEKLASLGALVAGVAHELNTPIGNAVTVASTLVQTQQRFAAQAHSGLTRSALAEYLQDLQEGGQIIERNLQRAAELIGSFKQLAVDQTSTQRRSFALHEVVHEITLAMRPALRKQPITLHEDIPAELQLDSYPGPLGQVLMNLIANALAHAFGERSSGTITVQAQATTPGWLRLSVRDDGSGIATEHQKKIFDPFFTTKLGQGGSGLGLHIVYTLVNGLLGGRIELHSQLGQGCAFVLHLPVSAPKPDPSHD